MGERDLMVWGLGLLPIWLTMAAVAAAAAYRLFDRGKKETVMKQLIKNGHAPAPIERKQADGSRAYFCDMCGERVAWRVPLKVGLVLTVEGHEPCAGRE